MSRDSGTGQYFNVTYLKLCNQIERRKIGHHAIWNDENLNEVLNEHFNKNTKVDDPPNANHVVANCSKAFMLAKFERGKMQ